MNFVQQDLIHHLGLTLLHFIWQGLLLGLLYGLVLTLWRPASANARYKLAVATLVALASLPALTFAWLATRPLGKMAAMSEAAETLALQAVNGLAPSVSADPLIWVVAAWLAGVLLLSARLAVGWHYVLRLRRSADFIATTGLSGLLESTRQRLAIGRKVMLAASNKVRAPLVIGYLKPLILFPPAMLNRLSLEQIEMVLAHEMAHIRRHDHLVNLFQTVVDTLLFYHPAVALVSRQIRIERENACDDLAVQVTGNRLGYVEMLASLERLRQPLPRLALSVQDGQILGRIRRLVEPSQQARQRGLTLPAVAVVVLLASTTAVYLLPEPDGSATAAVEQTVDTTAVLDDERVQLEAAPSSSPILTESDPLNWDFPDPAAAAQPSLPSSDPMEPDSAEISSRPTRRQSLSPAPVSEARQAAAEPAPTPTLPAVEPDLSDSGDEVSRKFADLNNEAETAPLQLAALPAAPRPRLDPPPVAEISAPVISGGELVHRVEPRFPVRARQRQARGLVELEFTVTADGQTRDIRILSEPQRQFGFGQAARNAVAQWRFEPFLQDQQPMTRKVRVEIEFDPDEGCLDLLGSRIPRC